MNITCPECSFSRTVDPTRVPDRLVKVSCPKCSHAFSFDKSGHTTNTADNQPEPVSREQITCPACGLIQDKDDSCAGCGVSYTRLQERQREHNQLSATIENQDATAASLDKKQENPETQHQAKAGFWIRVVAYLLDSLLLGAVQLVLSLLIDMVIGLMGIATEGDPAINMVLWMFGAVLSIGYAVFFTGYCGQTPGKMALRIKVIRTDGSPVTYGRAVLREVLGKFISSILLGIGYLMVAFDHKKQGLHDKIADTYVIKL